MKVSTHVIVQVLLMVVSIGTMISGQVPVKYQPLIVGLVSLAQGVIAWINHYYSPSGTVLPPTA
jgi:hypothetical protein